MSLKHICIEVRKQLQCINVFLQFEHSLEDSKSLLGINVTPEELCLQTVNGEKHIPLQQYFLAEAETLSGLVVEQHNASFRLRINNIQNATPSQKIVNKVPVLNEHLNDASTALIQLVCANCKCALNTQPVDGKKTFQRYREYPASGVDLSELFCHNTPQFDDVLVPQNTDFFYGYHFIVLNMQLLKQATRESQTQLYCARCLQHVGETILSQRAAKLWADALQLHLPDMMETEFTEIFSTDAEMSSTADLLHKIMHDCCLPEEQTFLAKTLANVKVVIFATLPDRSRQHILLHLLENKLQVLRNDGSTTQQTLKLQSNYSFKLLYKHLKESEPILIASQQDISIQSVQISPSLFVALINELQINALLIPHMYRYNNVDDLELSYIFY